MMEEPRAMEAGPRFIHAIGRLQLPRGSSD